MSETLELTLKIWRQPGPNAEGRFQEYKLSGISTHMSFLEMLDVLNEQLIAQGEEPVAFDHDCREGICGTCGIVINGQPHGPDRETTTCQLHMRRFQNGDTIVMDSGPAAGQMSTITGFVPATGAITFAPAFALAPAVGG